MPKVSEEYLESRRSEILDAAITCFARDGLHRATMGDIVQQAGLSRGAIYNYFQSKEDIVEAIAERRQERERQLVATALDTSLPGNALMRLRDAFIDELDDPEEQARRRVSVQLWAEAQRNPRIRKVVLKGFAEPQKLLTGVLAAEQKAGGLAASIDPGILASFVIAAFHGLVLQREWDRKFPGQAHKALLQRLFEALQT